MSDKIRRFKNRVVVPSLFNYLGGLDQSANLLASNSAIHPLGRTWQQAYLDVSVDQTPKYLVQLRDLKAHPTQSSDGGCFQDSAVPQLRTHTSIGTSLDPDEPDSNGGRPAETTQFSVSLADGTIVHLRNSSINLSHFKDLVSTITEGWNWASQRSFLSSQSPTRCPPHNNL